MGTSLTLHGYQHSVYSWITRLVLSEKGVTYKWIELDPFATDVSPDYLALNPFCRVPTMTLGAFVLYETSAIAKFVDEHFDGPRLQPTDVQDRARMAQVTSVLDHNGYWPMVRQVFAHGYYNTRVGEPVDRTYLVDGLSKSTRVLRVMDDWIGDGSFLAGKACSLADLHAAPMLSYFCEVPEGREHLEKFANVSSWYLRMRQRAAFIETRPELARLKAPPSA